MPLSRSGDGEWGSGRSPTHRAGSVAPSGVHRLEYGVDRLLTGQQPGHPGAESVVDLTVGPGVRAEGPVLLVGEQVGDRLVLREQVLGRHRRTDRNAALHVG